MFNSKSKRLGFLGTICFHVALLLFCFFSSIGHTTVEVPAGIEIEFIPYQELKKSSETIKKKNDTPKSDNTEFNNDDNMIEKNILKDNETVSLPNEQDSVTTALLDSGHETPSISQEVSDAMSTIFENQSEIDTDSLLETSNQESSSQSNDEKKSPNPSKEGLFNSTRGFEYRALPEYKCNEAGTVVILVRVNRKGETTWAEAGGRGSTIVSKCLVTEAIEAALKTTWEPGSTDSPEELAGKIIYNFQKN